MYIFMDSRNCHSVKTEMLLTPRKKCQINQVFVNFVLSLVMNLTEKPEI